MCACGRERNGANGIKKKLLSYRRLRLTPIQLSDVAHLREIGMEGGREGGRGGDKNEKKQ